MHRLPCIPDDFKVSIEENPGDKILHRRNFGNNSRVTALQGGGEKMITAKNLSKRFGKLVALDSISVKIERGFTLILGPNGGGKSTFLKLCAGLYRPSSGRVEVLGEAPPGAMKGSNHGLESPLIHPHSRSTEPGGSGLITSRDSREPMTITFWRVPRCSRLRVFLTGGLANTPQE